VLIKINECKSIDVDKLDIDSSLELEELLCDLDNERLKLLSRLDQYIKFQFQQRGITVIQNSYCGFDTEYELINESKYLNKLISSQTAIQRRTIVKVPAYNNYDMSYVHPLNSCVSDIYNSKVGMVDAFKYTFTHTNSSNEKSRQKLDEIKILNSSLKYSISLVKKYSMLPLITVNNLIVEKFKVVAGVDNFFYDCKHDQFVFVFPLSSLDTQIVYPKDGKFSFNDLLEMTKVSNSQNCSISQIRNKTSTKSSSLPLEDSNIFSSSEPTGTSPSFYKYSCGSSNESLHNSSESFHNSSSDNSISKKSSICSLPQISTVVNSFKGGSSLFSSSSSSSSYSNNTNTNTNTNTITITNTNTISNNTNSYLYSNRFGSSLRNDFCNILNIFYNLGLSNDKQLLID
jgi:hypothetical protein